MPVMLEPKQRYPIVLNCDKDKEKPPTFYAEALSGRESIANTKKVDEITSDEQVFEILETMVVNWKNMVKPNGEEIPFGSIEYPDLLTTAEAWELFGAINRNEHVSPDEKKS